MPRIPVYQPDLSGNERKYVTDCLDSTWISSKGKYISQFEEGFAAFVGTPHAVTVCNGTVALHLALLALGIGPGDEVLVPTLTYIASVNAIRYVGATPVFCDSLSDTWQIDPNDAAARVTPRTRAIMAVHLYGGACNMKLLRALCDKHNLKLIEDCAEAIGTRYFDRHVGTFGDIATFSFFGNKTITTGEGGMVVCSDPELGKTIRHLRGQGLAEGREYWHDVIGYNYRMTNICAALGVAQLERVDDILEAKRALAASYRKALIGSSLTFQAATEGELSSHWMVTVLAPTEQDRDSLRRELATAGIETRPIFHPVHRMPMYRQSAIESRCPRSDDLAARGMNLPSWHGISPACFTSIIDRIIDTIG